jgi:hypothetical protein
MISTLALATLLFAAPVAQDALDIPDAPTVTATRPAADSGLAIVPARLDLGTVAPGASVRASVWLVNTSLEPITVEKAKTGCGCTTVDFAPLTLEPGAAERVGFVVKAPDKVKTKNVKIDFHPEWGDRVTLTTALATSAEASADETPSPSGGGDAATGVLLVPVAGDLGEVAAGAAVETSAWLINAGDSAARIDDFKAGCGCTRVVGFTPTDLAPGAAKRVRLRVTPEARTKSGPVKTVTLDALVAGAETPVRAALTMTVHDQVAGGPPE